ncbi:MAG: DUF58 domain-containing protein [Bacteroidia bacterium]
MTFKSFFQKVYNNSLFLSNRLFLAIGVIVVTFLLAFVYEGLFGIAQLAFFALLALLVVDILMLYANAKGIEGRRVLPEKFSNGDVNPIYIPCRNAYTFAIRLRIIDEVPVQFQARDTVFELGMKAGEEKELRYELRPSERGEYHFGALNIYVEGPIGLVRKRYTFDADAMVPSYPSFIQMRQYQIMAISNRLSELGVKQVRRLGHTSEFEQIKEYVRGDDYRTLNWKATARSGKLMVNQYRDERAQHIYCLIDKSRNMKMPFEGLSLLDYAINASLVLSNIALLKQDKAGLIAFAENIDSIVPSSNRPTHMNLIMEVLYNQQTRYLEADYERLYTTITRKVSQRSLMILFTNFESLNALRRTLPYLKRLNRTHLLMVVFFENTELRELLDSQPQSMEEIYIKTIGENFAYEKKQIVRELERNGIIAILTTPQNLTVNTLNKYLELKARGMV